MEWFGLGIMLNARDNASSSLAKVSNSLSSLSKDLVRTGDTANAETQRIQTAMNQMSQNILQGMAMQQSGKELLSFSGSILSPLIEVEKQAISTGSQFEQWRMTLKALYKDEQTAIDKLNWGMKLAAETPFEVSDVTQALIGFKAVGAEADTMFANTNGEMRSFLEYIGDLASLRPDVGLQGVMMGVRNLLGGDGGRSLKMRMDIDFENILGRDFGSTTEEIMQDLVTVSDSLANGLMTELEGTWSQMISNLEDQSTRFFLAVADNGAFDKAKSTLKYISDAIGSIDDDKMKAIGTNIANAFNIMWKPVDLIVRGVTDFVMKITELIAQSPDLSKFVVTVMGLVGGFTALMGTLLIVGGTFIVVVNGIKLFGLALLNMKNHLIATVGKLVTYLPTFGKYALMGALIYNAWKNDLGGVRTVLTNFMKNVQDSFSYSTDIVNMSTEDMAKAFKELDQNTFSGWLTARLVELKLLWIGLCDAWSDYTLTDENFQKLNALGLLPVLENILKIKMKAEEFFKGFGEGFSNITTIAIDFAKGFAEIVEGIISKMPPFVEKIDEVNNSGKALDLKPWRDFGEVVGGFVAFLGIIKIVATVVKAVSSVVGFVMKIVGIVSKVWGFITTIVTGVGMIVTTILTLFGVVVALPAEIVGLITLAVIGIIALLIKHRDTVVEIIKGVVKVIGAIIETIVLIFVAVLGAIAVVVASGIATIVTIIGLIVVAVSAIVLGIIGLIRVGWELIVGIVSTAITIITTILTTIVGVIASIIAFIVGFFQTGFAVIQAVIQTFCAIAKAIFTGDFSSLADTLGGIWSRLGDKLSAIWDGVSSSVRNIWDTVGSFLSSAWNNLGDKWNGIMSNIKNIGSETVSSIKGVWEGITSFFSGIWDSIISSATAMFDWIGSKFSWVSDLAKGVKSLFDSDDTKPNVSPTRNGVSNQMVGLATGGYVKTEGVAMLHPNEVVVNDDLTQRLRTFLDENGNGEPVNSRPQLNSLDVARSISRNISPEASNSNTTQQVDNSIVFSEGAIQVTLSGDTNQDVEKLFKEFSKRLQKEQSLRKTLNYKLA